MVERLRRVGLRLSVLIPAAAAVSLILFGVPGSARIVSIHGIDISGTPGDVNILGIARWSFLSLPVYLLAGFELFRMQGLRNCLLPRHRSYRAWFCRQMTLQWLGAAAFCGSLWGILRVTGWQEPAVDGLILFFLFLSVLSGIQVAVWEWTKRAESVFVVIAMVYVWLTAAYYLPLTAGERLLMIAGMDRYVTSAADVLRVAVVEVGLMAAEYLMLPGIVRNRA